MKEITEKMYYTIKDKVTKIRNMKAAAKHVLDKAGSAGVDRIDTVEFKKNYAVHMRELYREFLEDRYQPKPALRVFIPKSDGRQRPLGIPTVKDRTAQATVTWRYKRPKKKSLEKFKDKVRKVTKRNQPWKVESIIKRLNAKIYGEKESSY